MPAITIRAAIGGRPPRGFARSGGIYAAVMAMGAAMGVAGGVATRLVESGGKSAGSLTDIVTDAVVGAGTAGLVKGGGAVVSNIAKKAAPKVANAVGKIRSLSSEKIFQKQYKQLGQAARKANPCNCFAKGTLVWTAMGLRPIEELRVGDQVLSWNEETGEIALKPVTETFVTPDRPLLDLTIAGGTSSEVITTTPGHPFWVEGSGWVHAAQLTGGPASTASPERAPSSALCATLCQPDLPLQSGSRGFLRSAGWHGDC